MASAPGANTSVEPGRVIGGKYRLVRRLAEGGMGEVWVARHEDLDADVAVKLMSAEIVGTEHAIARFEREAKASAKLRSNHIVRVQDFGVDGETPYMVMELLEGEDLGTR
ncbi:MAG: protein kinase, partial [Polyangiaceae bacterium]